MTRALLVVDVLIVIMSAAQIEGPLRFIVALLFTLAVPGWSVVGFLKLKEFAVLVSLTVATSLAFEMLLGEVVLTRWWHLQILEMLLGIVCGCLLYLQVKMEARASESPGT